MGTGVKRQPSQNQARQPFDDRTRQHGSSVNPRKGETAPRAFPDGNPSRAGTHRTKPQCFASWAFPNYILPHLGDTPLAHVDSGRRAVETVNGKGAPGDSRRT